jgi:hypothetical protein
MLINQNMMHNTDRYFLSVYTWYVITQVLLLVSYYLDSCMGALGRILRAKCEPTHVVCLTSKNAS